MRPVLTCGHSSVDSARVHALLTAAGLPSSRLTGPFNAEALEAQAQSDHDLAFVLVYTRPEHALAQALKTQSEVSTATQQATADWLRDHDHLLRFYLRQQHRCVLVEAVSAGLDRQQFPDKVASQFGVALGTEAAASDPEPDDREELAACAARALIEGHRDLEAMKLELDSHACIDPMQSQRVSQRQVQAWAQYQHLVQDLGARCDQVDRLEATLAQQITDLTQAQSRHSSELEAAASARAADVAALAQAQAALQSLKLEMQEQASLAASSLSHSQAEAQRALAQADAAQGLQAELAALKAENAELLQQLHQAQEELEGAMLGGRAEVQQLQAAVAAQQQETASQIQLAQLHAQALRATQEERDEWAAAAGSRQAQVENLSQMLGQQAELASSRLTRLEAIQAEHGLAMAEREHLMRSLDTARQEQQALQQQCAALQQECDRRQQLLDRPSETAPLKAQIEDLTQECELLVMQLHRVQEDLEHYTLQHRALVAREKTNRPLLAFLQQHWADQQSDEIVIDMHRQVAGTNWHASETDGRWAGPATTSVPRWPALRPGLYNVRVDVIDAMSEDILQGTEMWLNGSKLGVELLFDGFPAVLHANAQVAASDPLLWELELRFPRLISPTERGVPDDRLLALKVASVLLTWMGEPQAA